MIAIDDELKKLFLEEAAQLLEDTEQCFVALEKNGFDAPSIEKIFRLAHNLKGSGNAVGFQNIGELTHSLESVLLRIKNRNLDISKEVVDLLLNCNDRLSLMVTQLSDNTDATFDNLDLLNSLSKYHIATGNDSENHLISSDKMDAGAIEFAGDFAEFFEINKYVEVDEAKILAQEPETQKPKKDESIRVSLDKIDKLLNDVGELVILQSVLNQLKSESSSTKLYKTISQLSKITKNIHDVSMGLRMVPIRQTFQKMQRIVRDTSASLGKQINLELVGEDTEVDKTILEKLGDPLVHLIRNAADHGIESAEIRKQKGKPEVGTIRLKAFHRSGNLMIEVSDDGGGLDAAIVKRKAIEKRIISADKALTDRECHNLIFLPGFSTKAVVSDISGRGVGMDVVKTNIEIMKGDVQLESEMNNGTCFTIRLPLTLSIIDAMTVIIDKERYVIPLSHVHESTQPSTHDVHNVTGLGVVFSLRGENLPLYHLSHLLGKKSAPMRAACESIAIVSRSSDQNFAVLVDDILGRHQVVIKQLGMEHRNLKGFSGSTIMGDGKAALIIELPELVAQFKGVVRRPAA